MVLSYYLSAPILLSIRYLIHRSSCTPARGCVCLARCHASVLYIHKSFTLCRQRSLCSDPTRHAELTQHNPPSAAAAAVQEEAAGFWVDYRSRQPSLTCVCDSYTSFNTIYKRLGVHGLQY